MAVLGRRRVRGRPFQWVAGPDDVPELLAVVLVPNFQLPFRPIWERLFDVIFPAVDTKPFCDVGEIGVGYVAKHIVERIVFGKRQDFGHLPRRVGRRVVGGWESLKVEARVGGDKQIDAAQREATCRAYLVQCGAMRPIILCHSALCAALSDVLIN